MIGTNAFQGYFGVMVYDFTHCTGVPTLTAASAIAVAEGRTRILVPAVLEEEWKAANGWSVYGNEIMRL